MMRCNPVVFFYFTGRRYGFGYFCSNSNRQ